MSRSRKPRILFLNRSYWPDTEATGQLLASLCEGLADDFDVHVLAGQPNAVSTHDDWTQTSVRNGVTIHRASHTTFPKRFMLLKAWNFISFVRACRRKIGSLPRPDVVVFETDPFLLPFVADRMRRTFECRLVGYLQDIYPDVAVALGKVKNNWAIRRLRQSLFRIYRNCDRMVVLSEDMRRLLLKHGVSAEKVEVIPNWADTELIRPVDGENRFVEKFGLAGKFVVMYSGNLGLTQRLEDFILAAELLKDDASIVFVFVGQGARKKDLQQQVDHLGLNNVLFCDYQPLADLSHSLSAADLHLVPLTRELSECLMPSKLYGILAAGRPYLTNAPQDSELFDITVQHQVGITIPPGFPPAIADAIRDASKDPQALKTIGHHSRQLAESRFTRQHAVKAFSQMLFRVI